MDNSSFYLIMSGILAISIVTSLVAGIFLGGWLFSRGVKMGTDKTETFIGRQPQGEVFTIPIHRASEFSAQTEAAPDQEEARIMDRVKQFKQRFERGVEKNAG